MNLDKSLELGLFLQIHNLLNLHKVNQEAQSNIKT